MIHSCGLNHNELSEQFKILPCNYKTKRHNNLPLISGKVTALVPKGMIGDWLLLLLSCRPFIVGEPRDARGPLNRPLSPGVEALFVPIERRRGENPEWECFATGLTCQVFGAGGVSLIL